MATSVSHKSEKITTTFDSDGDNTAQAGFASSCRLMAIQVSNSNNADAFIQLFDAATTSVTVGTTTPKHSFLVPKGDGTASGSFTLSLTPMGIDFDTALTYACTTSATGSGDPSAGLVVNLVYAEN